MINAISPTMARRGRQRGEATLVHHNSPTVARYAVTGTVPRAFTDALWIGERVRAAIMSQSQAVSKSARPVFSGKRPDGHRLDAAHGHAHFLCEANAGVDRVTHLTLFAPMGFAHEDEVALSQLQRVWGCGSQELQLVLIGIGRPEDFGRTNTKVGQTPLLAEARVWISRTPLVLTRHLKVKVGRDAGWVERQQAIADELCCNVQLELSRRPQFAAWVEQVRIEPMLRPEQCGTKLGGQFMPWTQFRRQRRAGRGRQAGLRGYGFRLEFPEPVRGPIALGYGCHFGLGQFWPEEMTK